jgi:hypothetical protein
MSIRQFAIELDGKPGSPKKKWACPSCHRKGSFRRYYNYETAEYLSEDCGVCDRVDKCGYTLSPKEYFKANPAKRPRISGQEPGERLKEIICPKPVHIPEQVLLATLCDYDTNSFIVPLIDLFGASAVQKAVEMYYIGTETTPISSADRKGVAFPFINQHGQIRAIQVKQFGADLKTESFTVGESVIKAFWIHKLIRNQCKRTGAPVPEWVTGYEAQDLKVDCLFGAHLLSDRPDAVVGICESPKNAVIASMVFPHMVWVATSSLSYLTKERLQCLAGRSIILYPDCGLPNPKTGKTPRDLWHERVSEFPELAEFYFSTLLDETVSDEKKGDGYDLGDLLVDEASRKHLRISIREILRIPSHHNLGARYGHLRLSSLWLRDGRKFDLLTDIETMPVVAHESIPLIEQDFRKKPFSLATIDNVQFLVSPCFS